MCLTPASSPLGTTIRWDHASTSQPRGRLKQSAEYSLLRRLDEHRDEVLLFFEQPGVPFDNNQAERDLHMLKVQQKTSGCFRTQQGASMLCTFRSYVCTAKKLGLNLLDSITLENAVESGQLSCEAPKGIESMSSKEEGVL